MTQQDEWLTVAEITEQIKVHAETVRRWLRQGDLPGRNFGGKMGYRVRRSDLDAFLTHGGQHTGPAAQ